LHEPNWPRVGQFGVRNSDPSFPRRPASPPRYSRTLEWLTPLRRRRGCRTGRHSSCAGSIGSGRNCSLIDEVGGRKCGADFAPMPNPFHRHYPPPSRPGATQLHSLHRNQRTSAMVAAGHEEPSLAHRHGRSSLTTGLNRCCAADFSVVPRTDSCGAANGACTSRVVRPTLVTPLFAIRLTISRNARGGMLHGATGLLHTPAERVACRYDAHGRQENSVRQVPCNARPCSSSPTPCGRAYWRVQPQPPWLAVVPIVR
jgi:hypothetical protein